MQTATDIKRELKIYANKEKAEFFPKFFKTGKGQYGEGDQFIGVTVPNQRLVAKTFSSKGRPASGWKGLPLQGIQKLLKSKVHEHRLTALFILVNQFKKASKDEQETIYKFYLSNTKHINNWDLVDSSASYILGKYLHENPNYIYTFRDTTLQGVKILEFLAKSDNLWERRIAMLAAGEFIKHGQPEVTMKIAQMLLKDNHDLIHKAVGWMLREVGKRDQKLLEQFLKENYTKMPRTTLRYAIEKFSKQKKVQYTNS